MEEKRNSEQASRRQALKQIMGLPVLGGLAGGLAFSSHEERILRAESEAKADAENSSAEIQTDPDGVSGATRTDWKFPKPDELKEKVPHAKIGDIEISRMIMGGNLIGGWAHSRDLLYVSELVKRYHTKEKVFATFHLAEECGINTFIGNPIMNSMMEEYWAHMGGQMQFISDCGYNDDMRVSVKEAIDFGCTACYIHGGMGDRLVEEGNFKMIEDCFQLMRDAGLPAGIGAHYQKTVDGLVQAGIEPDFWMKTFHHTDYWSAHSETEEDNIFCREPDATREFMAKTDTPWIAFKVLAAGAIMPEVGFRYALEGGADFVCVGMYDFQMVDDVNIFCPILKDLSARKRRWLPDIVEEEEIK